jgi:hypothetical protein
VSIVQVLSFDLLSVFCLKPLISITPNYLFSFSILKTALPNFLCHYDSTTNTHQSAIYFKKALVICFRKEVISVTVAYSLLFDS